MNYIEFILEHFKKAKKIYKSFFNYFFDKIITNFYLSLKKKNYIKRIFKISKKLFSHECLNVSQGLISEKYQIHKKLIKISIIIIYSSYENMENIIISLNNQTFEYFEIIIVFDIDYENIDHIFINYIKSFDNIKLIKNKSKKGKLKSINKGITFAKGKYLLILDQNCFFINDNALENIYTEITRERSDILEFNLYKITTNNYTSLYRCNHFLTQFNFSHIKYNLRFDDIDISKELLTNKLIKSNYFKKILKRYNLKDIEIIIDKFYNDIFSFIINSNEPKFRRTNSTNLYMDEKYFEKKKFNDFSTANNKLKKETIFYINFIFDNSKNTFKEKETIIDIFFNVLSIIFNKFTNISKSSLELIHKFLDCKYISEPNKNFLKFYYYSLIN